MFFRQILHEDLGCASYVVADGGDAIELGNVRIVALATPGHRPEHLAFVVEDRSRGERAWLALTGDSLFVGDVARPDLAIEPREGARGLYASARKLLELDDFAEVWPGHIGGSLCGGGGMSEKPGSTIGFERRFNPLLRVAGEDEFVRELASELEPQPPNFERIVELNRGPLVTESAPVQPLAPQRVHELLEAGAVLVDGRDPREFDAEHVPGSINVTMTKSAVGTRAAWVVDAETEVVVLGGSDADAAPLTRMLEAVGFRRLRGYLSGGIAAWREAGLEVATTPAIDVHGLAERLRRDEVVLLDVRDDDEWGQGHVEGSLHVPYYELRDGAPAEVREAAKPIVVACSAGNRSSLAASLLRRAGIHDLVHVADGGVADLEGEGVELVRAESPF